MSALSTFSAATRRRPVSTLGKITIGALVSIALSLFYAQIMLSREFDMMLTAFAALMLIGAGIIWTGWRWAPLVGSVLSALVILGNSGPVIYDLTHPQVFRLFSFMVIAVSSALVGIFAGISATVQNYRGGELRAPRATGIAFASLVGIMIGALAIGSLADDTKPGIAPEMLANLPGITTPSFSFDKPELQAQVGETVALRLENTHEIMHSFDLDELNVHVSVLPGQQNLVLFKPSAPGTYTFYCAIPGHREAGMVGTLVVK